MNKWFGAIGYAEQVESAPDVWCEEIGEREYYGDIVRNTRKLQTSDQLNDNINIANDISIIADPYALNHFHDMRYAIFQDVKWKITNVEVQYPRLILQLGGVYNG